MNFYCTGGTVRRHGTASNWQHIGNRWVLYVPIVGGCQDNSVTDLFLLGRNGTKKRERSSVLTNIRRIEITNTRTHFLESTRVDRSGHCNSTAAEEKIITITNGEGSGAAQHPPTPPPTAGETPWKLGFILPQVVDPNCRPLVQTVRTG
jgi:hypothetical protein